MDYITTFGEQTLIPSANIYAFLMLLFSVPLAVWLLGCVSVGVCMCVCVHDVVGGKERGGQWKHRGGRGKARRNERGEQENGNKIIAVACSYININYNIFFPSESFNFNIYIVATNA